MHYCARIHLNQILEFLRDQLMDSNEAAACPLTRTKLFKVELAIKKLRRLAVGDVHTWTESLREVRDTISEVCSLIPRTFFNLRKTPQTRTNCTARTLCHGCTEDFASLLEKRVEVPFSNISLACLIKVKEPLAHHTHHIYRRL